MALATLPAGLRQPAKAPLASGNRPRNHMQSARALRGTKRTCTSCGVRFYDLDSDPIVCPACNFAHAPSAFVRLRSAVPIAEAKPKPAPVADEDEADLEIEGVGLADDDALIAPDDDLDDDDDAIVDVTVDVDDEEEES
jgi:uncharacterized protein (TIGR02300 family)